MKSGMKTFLVASGIAAAGAVAVFGIPPCVRLFKDAKDTFKQTVPTEQQMLRQLMSENMPTDNIPGAQTNVYKYDA